MTIDKESPLYSMMMRERVMDKAQATIADCAEPVALARLLNIGGTGEFVEVEWRKGCKPTGIEPIPLYAAPAADAGKVLVPAEPTEAMLTAVKDIYNGGPYNVGIGKAKALEIYRAMLAAAKEGE